MSQPFGSMPDSNNPFSPPQDSKYAAPQRRGSKPTMANVFGILNLVFGGSSLLMQGVGLIMIFFLREKFEEFSKQSFPLPGPLQFAGMGITLLLTVWLIYSGIRVLSGTMSGRSAFIAYCIGSLLIRPFVLAINLVAQYEQMQQQFDRGGAPMLPVAAGTLLVVMGLLTLVFAEVYEAIGFFVIRSKNVTQEFQAWDEVVNFKSGDQNLSF